MKPYSCLKGITYIYLYINWKPFHRMAKIEKIIMILIVVLYSCGNKTTNNLTREEILQKGARLFMTHGCNICHSLDGTVVYGPPLNDIYMKEITVIRNGRQRNLKAGRKYLMQSVTDPRYEKNLEYRNKEMPLTSLPKEDAQLLVEYLIAMGTKAEGNK